MERLVIDPKTNGSVFTYYSEFEYTWPGQTLVEVIVLVILLVIAFSSNILALEEYYLLASRARLWRPGGTPWKVIMAVYRKRANLFVTDIFIANIAVSDLLYAGSIPMIMTARISPQWLLGLAGCRVLQFTQCWSATTSIITMLIISVDRYITICHSMVAQNSRWSIRQLTNRKCLIVVLLTWVLTFIMCCPILAALTVRHIPRNNGEELEEADYDLIDYDQSDEFESDYYVFCAIKWPVGFHATAYLGVLALTMFIIPLTVTAIAYTKTFQYVRKISAGIRHARCFTSSIKGGIRNKISYPEIRLVKMFVAIEITFFATWCPLFIIVFLILHTDLLTSSYFLMCIFLTKVTPCINPVLYGYFNESYRDGIKSIILRRRTRSASTVTIDSNISIRSRNNSLDELNNTGVTKLQVTDTVVTVEHGLTDEHAGNVTMDMDLGSNSSVNHKEHYLTVNNTNNGTIKNLNNSIEELEYLGNDCNVNSSNNGTIENLKIKELEYSDETVYTVEHKQNKYNTSLEELNTDNDSSTEAVYNVEYEQTLQNSKCINDTCSNMLAEHNTETETEAKHDLKPKTVIIDVKTLSSMSNKL